MGYNLQDPTDKTLLVGAREGVATEGGEEMRQIPSEGEYCSSCFMLHHLFEFGVCLLYKEVLVGYKRLPQCLKDRPQILTWVEREALKAEGYEACRKDMEV